MRQNGEHVQGTGAHNIFRTRAAASNAGSGCLSTNILTKEVPQTLRARTLNCAAVVAQVSVRHRICGAEKKKQFGARGRTRTVNSLASVLTLHQYNPFKLVIAQNTSTRQR